MKKYAVLDTVVLDFITHQDQYSCMYGPEDDVRILVEGPEVYLLYAGEKHSTINGPDLIAAYLKHGTIEEVR